VTFTVRRRAQNAVTHFKRQMRHSRLVNNIRIPPYNGEGCVVMSLHDEQSNLMTMELVAPNQRQTVRLAKSFESKAEMIYNLTMNALLEEEE
jgi:hypothetical protein